MSLIPIKLLKNGTTKNTLLNLKNETSEVDTDDYIESRIMTNSRARKLLAIEDASEMAKLYLHKKGVFEKIAADLKKETGKDFTFHSFEHSWFLFFDLSVSDHNSSLFPFRNLNLPVATQVSLFGH